MNSVSAANAIAVNRRCRASELVAACSDVACDGVAAGVDAIAGVGRCLRYAAPLKGSCDPSGFGNFVISLRTLLVSLSVARMIKAIVSMQRRALARPLSLVAKDVSCWLRV
jgi:hypothetical protein